MAVRLLAALGIFAALISCVPLLAAGRRALAIPPAPCGLTDLEITSKTVDNPTPNVGENVTFRITLHNNGPDTATNIQVEERLPTGLLFVSANPSAGSYGGNTWSFPLLLNGASETLQITATVLSEGDLESRVNTAQVYREDQLDPDSRPGNLDPSEDDQKSVTVDPKDTDLSIDKSVNDAAPNVGDTIHYSLAIANAGHESAENTVVKDIVPTGLTISNISNGGVFDAGTRTITWNLGTVAPRFSATLTYDATVTGSVDLESAINTATITSTTFDPNTADNQDTVTVDAKDADLSLTKDVDNSNPNPDDLIKYTIKISNAGHEPAAGVQVQDNLPSGMTLQGSSASQGSYTAGVWTAD